MGNGKSGKGAERPVSSPRGFPPLPFSLFSFLLFGCCQYAGKGLPSLALSSTTAVCCWCTSVGEVLDVSVVPDPRPFRKDRTMLRLTVSGTTILLAWSLLGATGVFAEESNDVIFSTPDQSGRPTTANFYFNDRAIGAGREGFAEIVERIEKLPAGTSVVWGPNYHRCGECSGTEPGCVPRFLYPDLWAKLVTAVAAHHLLLSSDFPGPFLMHVGPGRHGHGNMPLPWAADDPEAKQPFDATLDWEVSEFHLSDAARRKWPDIEHVVVGRFLSDGKKLANFDLDLSLGQLAENARVLIRVSWSDDDDLPEEEDDLKSMAKAIRTAWPSHVNEGLERGKLTAVLTARAPLVQALQAEIRQEQARQRLVLDWHNFRGPDTPAEEVLYCANGQYLGRGDAAFRRFLSQLDRLPPESKVAIPRFEFRGRWLTEGLSSEEIEAKNIEVQRIAPYRDRRDELEATIAKRNLTVEYLPASPGENSDTVLGWNSGDRYGNTFVSFGRIIHYDEEPAPAAAKLAWTDYEAAKHDEDRQGESEAVYTLNGTKTGGGVAGFAKAMEKLEQLPPGSVVQVRVCLRTKGPFRCPLTFAGHRHFERTGFEPYFGLFPWLLDVAQKGNLEIEWIPDERPSCGDCELNM